MWGEPDLPVFDADVTIDWLYCISKYPAPLNEVALGRVDFTVFSGFSDHTVGITAAQAAFARGARIVEKHFTLDKTMYGPDHSCSMDQEELKRLAMYRDELKQCLD